MVERACRYDSQLVQFLSIRFTTWSPDIGTISILWSQPISALQILSPDGKWRWIKHIDNALVRY